MGSLDCQDHEAVAKILIVWGDVRMLGQRRKNLCPAVSWESTAGHGSARVVMDCKRTTAKCVNCVWCGRPRRRWRECWKQLSAEAKLVSQKVREASAAYLSSDGIGEAGSRTGDVALSGTEELEAGI